ncbi:MAG: DNA-3-methyladenine glycosylase 2 family protein [Ktedonobacteraceae bacterium]
MRYELTLRTPFNLAITKEYFGGWTAFGPEQPALAMVFPVEGWRTSAAVILQQDGDGSILGEVYGAGEDTARAWQQALAVLSLDSDGSGWSEVGQRDPVIGGLQEAYHCLRPVLFHSPYEAAAAFIIGHRISIQQGRAIRQAMAQEMGEKIQAGEAMLYAFPRPQVLRELSSFKGVNPEKVQRLHGIAQAALDGLLDRAYLRSLPVAQSLEKLRTLPGIGPFFSQGILLRGAGFTDEVPDDDVTREAIQRAYQLPDPPDRNKVLQIAEAWRPYRMWAAVLLHVWLRREMGGPHRQGRTPAARRQTRSV